MTHKAPKIFLTILITATIITPTAIFCINTTMPRYLQFFQAPHGKNYDINTLFIDVSQTIRTMGNLIYYSTFKKNDLDEAINTIKKQRAQLEKLIKEEEQTALAAIKNRFAVDDIIWDACLNDIQELQTIYDQALQQPCPTAYHDENIPTDLLNIITTMLCDNNINPQSISIQIAAPQEEKSTLMRVRHQIRATINPHTSELIITKQYLPPVLEIIPVIIKQSLNPNIFALCAHEIQHIIQHHVLTEVILQAYLKHYCAIDYTQLLNYPEFHQFIETREAQAELLAAIKSPTIANHFMDYRSYSYYPEYLYEDHYYRLSIIAMFWKLESWLTWYQQQ